MAQRLESKSNNQIYHYPDFFYRSRLIFANLTISRRIATYGKSVIERILKVFGNPAIAVKIRGPRSRAGLIA